MGQWFLSKNALLVPVVLLTICGKQVLARQENFCKPLEDYGPRQDVMETRKVCRTELKKNCQPVTESGCLEVTELRCSVMLTTNCTMDWINKEKVESVMGVVEKNLKNCTKGMVREFHNKTVYDCKNVTKVHCTTLWTVDEKGEKVWAGNEDDCKDVTWEECYPVSKQVPMLVAEMTCTDIPVSYFDYENTSTPVMADTLDCRVEKVPVCEPLTLTKCDEVTYTKCEETPETVCTTVEIPVPSQPKLHKQWCLFDQEENIDFDRQVRIINEKAREVAINNATLALEEEARGGGQSAQGNLPTLGSEFDPIFIDFSNPAGFSIDIRKERSNPDDEEEAVASIPPSRRGLAGHNSGRKASAGKKKKFGGQVKVVRKQRTVTSSQ